MDYRYGSHTVFKIGYHFVWVTKYRYPVLKGDVGERVRVLVPQTCEAKEYLEHHFEPDPASEFKVEP